MIDDQSKISKIKYGIKSEDILTKMMFSEIMGFNRLLVGATYLMFTRKINGSLVH